jgi:putative oxidoreductase
MSDLFDLIGRILIAILFVVAGLGKIANPSGTLQYIAMGGLPLPLAAYVVAVLIEVGGGIAFLLGWQTRLIGGLLALFSLVTAFTFHTHFADHNQQIHFMKNLAIAGGLLHYAAFGAGAWSLDRRMGTRMAGTVSAGGD